MEALDAMPNEEVTLAQNIWSNWCHLESDIQLEAARCQHFVAGDLPHDLALCAPRSDAFYPWPDAAALARRRPRHHGGTLHQVLPTFGLSTVLFLVGLVISYRFI